jgi:formate hydrogenlyase subunit 3/multisubunit Na+/H+ antiporter MnhD subunit
LEDLYRYITYALSILLVFSGGTTRLFDKKSGVLLRVVGFILVFVYSFIVIRDLFAKCLAISSSIIALLVTIYTTNYIKFKYGLLYLQLLIDVFSLSITFTFISRYLVEFIAWWIIAGITGFILIIFDWITLKVREALEAGIRYLLVSKVPADITLFSLIALSGFEKAFAVDLVDLAPPIEDSLTLTIIAMMGFMAKAAIAPLHFWLPDAHSLAPSPASAMLSGLLVKMGVYRLYLLTHYLINVNTYAHMLMICGSITAIYGGLQALAQTDIKRILAYSTISHMGVIAILLGLHVMYNSIEALQAALFYTIAHAFFKASLFMDSGVIEIIARTRDIGSLGYISRIYPLESTSALLALLSLIGVPPLPGFIAKFVTVFSMIAGLKNIAIPIVILCVVVAIEIALSVGYGARYLSAHFGTSTIKITPPRQLEYLKQLTLPILIATVASIIFTTYILLTLFTIYASILTIITIILLILLTIIIYVIHKSQKIFRIDESWLGGARP